MGNTARSALGVLAVVALLPIVSGVGLAAPGRLDSTFGPAGTLTTNVGRSGSAFAMALQADGKIVVAGNAGGGYVPHKRMFAVVRYLANGGLDPAFGAGGMLTTDFDEDNFASASAVAIQGDGRILVAGVTAKQAPDGSATSRFALARYQADGRLDAGFGAGGKVVTEFPNHRSAGASALALQADGKIIAAGGVGAGQFGVPNDVAIVRYHSNGSLDLSFGSGGRVIADFGGDDSISAVGIQADGQIVVAGSTGGPFGSDSTPYDVVLARYSRDGSPDSTFGAGGKVTADFGGGEFAAALAIQPDGRIVLATSNHDFVVARFTTTGGLDPSFGSGGKVTTDFGGYDSASAVALGANGTIVVAGTMSINTFQTSVQSFALARYHFDGKLDLTFGAGGKVITSFREFVEGRAAAVLPDGRIMVAGGPDLSSPSRDNFVLARYNPNGSLDLTFRGTGRISTDFGGDDFASAVAVQPDGKIVVVGTTLDRVDDTNAFALCRYHPDGRLDLAFGSGGKVVTRLGGFPFALALQADGKPLVAGGVSLADGNAALALVRYHANGGLDAGFGDGGTVVTPFGQHSYVTGLALQSDGKIVVTGPAFFSDRVQFVVARYGTDGSLDPSFGTGGKVVTDFGGYDFASAVAIQHDGKIIVAGSTATSAQTTAFALARYASDGRLDPGFGNGGKVVSDFGLRRAEAFALALQPDGKIVAAGGSAFENADVVLARYDAAGSPDPSFGAGGFLTTDLGASDAAAQLALERDGKILVSVNSFTRIDPRGPFSVRSVLARYTSSGSLDSSFGTAGIVDTDGAAFALQADGRIVVVGPSTPFVDDDFTLARYTGDLPTTSVTTNQLVYRAGDFATVAITTDPGLSADRWYMLVALATPDNTPDDPLFVYRFDPVVELLTFDEARSRPLAAVAARPVSVLQPDSLTILTLTVPAARAGVYEWRTVLVSEDLTRISNVATASFELSP